MTIQQEQNYTSGPEFTVPRPDFDRPIDTRVPTTALSKSVTLDLAELGYVPANSAEAEQKAAATFSSAQRGLLRLTAMELEVDQTYRDNMARLEEIREGYTSRIGVLKKQKTEVFGKLEKLCAEREPIQQQLTQTLNTLHGTLLPDETRSKGLQGQLEDAKEDVTKKEGEVTSTRASRDVKRRRIEDDSRVVGYTTGQVDERWDHANKAPTEEIGEQLLLQTNYGPSGFTHELKHTTVETPSEQMTIDTTSKSIEQFRQEVEELDEKLQVLLQELGAHKSRRDQLELQVHAAEQYIIYCQEKLVPIDEQIGTLSKELVSLIMTTNALEEEMAQQVSFPVHEGQKVIEGSIVADESEASRRETDASEIRAQGHIVTDTAVHDALVRAEGVSQQAPVTNSEPRQPRRRIRVPLIGMSISLEGNER